MFQFATLIDGLMVIVLTLRASLKELALLGGYILIGVLFFGASASNAELLSPPGEGIPDCQTGTPGRSAC